MSNFLESILNPNSKIHMIGIGGISMSAIAELLIYHGFSVSGSDIKESAITEKLEGLGVEIFIGQEKDNIKDADLVCYTAAINPENPELKEARAKGILCLERAELLGKILEYYEKPIAVAGTHGKTTTTSMLSLILLKASKNPTVLIGGELPQIGGTLNIGEREHIVFEACEYVESFLNFRPFLSIITNIEEDHLDYFRDLYHIITSFEKFSRLNNPLGAIFVCSDDKNIKTLVQNIENKVITYGIFDKDAQYIAKNIKINQNKKTEFDVFDRDAFVMTVTLNVFGKHNILNALGAISCALYMGIDKEDIKAGLLEFSGTKRRFEEIGFMKTKEGGKATVIDDYAHHPTEIKATIDSAEKWEKNKLWCVFQPHTYTRTKAFLDGFATVFSDKENVIILDIYPAREKYDGTIHSCDLVQKIKNAVYINDFTALKRYLKNKAEDGDLILCMGAGDITKASEMLLYE